MFCNLSALRIVVGKNLRRTACHQCEFRKRLQEKDCLWGKKPDKQEQIALSSVRLVLRGSSTAAAECRRTTTFAMVFGNIFSETRCERLLGSCHAQERLPQNAAEIQAGLCLPCIPILISGLL